MKRNAQRDDAVHQKHHLKVIFGMLRPFRRQLIAILALTACLSIVSMGPPLITRAVINRVITDGDHSVFLLLAALLFLVPVLDGIGGFIQQLGIGAIGQKFVMNLRCAIYEHLLHRAMRFFSSHGTGMLVNRLMGDTGVVQQMLQVQTVQALSDLICSIFAIAVAFYLNWRLAIPLLLLVFLFVLNYRMNIRRIQRTTRGYRNAEDRLAGGIQNRLSADVTVKTFGAEGREHQTFMSQSAEALNLVEESQLSSRTFSMNTALLQELGRTLIYFTGCAMVLRETATYGDVVAFTAYAMQLLGPAVRFSYLSQQFQSVHISLGRLFELMEGDDEIRPRSNPVALKRTRGQIDFNNVKFHYEPRKPVLRGVDFHVVPGETVALVGPTGCGKSTILSLLMRFYDVVSGSITMDGVDLRDLDVRQLRRQYGIVLQESLLFSVSIADNIAYSTPGASRAEIERAARIAEAHEVIMALPNGYDSIIGDRNVQLSVVEAQRISIARAVLADPPVLIMDEATSALDSESEAAIQRAMDRFLQGRTSFIVAHRLSTIRNADRIILMRDGCIHEMGNHDALMQREGGLYRELYNKHVGHGVLEE